MSNDIKHTPGLKNLQSLLKGIDDLQSRIYDSSSRMDDKGQKEISELLSESGFELDAARQKMEENLLVVFGFLFWPQVLYWRGLCLLRSLYI